MVSLMWWIEAVGFPMFLCFRFSPHSPPPLRPLRTFAEAKNTEHCVRVQSRLSDRID